MEAKIKYRLQYNSWILRRYFSSPNANNELVNMKIVPPGSNISSLRRYKKTEMFLIRQKHSYFSPPVTSLTSSQAVQKSVMVKKCYENSNLAPPVSQITYRQAVHSKKTQSFLTKPCVRITIINFYFPSGLPVSFS